MRTSAMWGSSPPTCPSCSTTYWVWDLSVWLGRPEHERDTSSSTPGMQSSLCAAFRSPADRRATPVRDGRHPRRSHPRPVRRRPSGIGRRERRPRRASRRRVAHHFGKAARAFVQSGCDAAFDVVRFEEAKDVVSVGRSLFVARTITACVKLGRPSPEHPDHRARAARGARSSDVFRKSARAALALLGASRRCAYPSASGRSSGARPLTTIATDRGLVGRTVGPGAAAADADTRRRAGNGVAHEDVGDGVRVTGNHVGRGRRERDVAPSEEIAGASLAPPLVISRQ